MRNVAISNSDDMINSRNIIARIEELVDEQETLESAVTEAEEALNEEGIESDEHAARQDALNDAESALREWDGADELKALQTLADEAEGYTDDWRHGAVLIADHYFTEYCQELITECGDLPRDLPRHLVIDWDATAENLKADYTEVDFEGTPYFVR